MQMHWVSWEPSQEALYCSFSLTLWTDHWMTYLHHSLSSMVLASDQKPDTSSIPRITTTSITFRHSPIAWSKHLLLHWSHSSIPQVQAWVVMILWSARVYHHPTYHHQWGFCYLHIIENILSRATSTTYSLSLGSSKSWLWEKALDTRNLF